MENRKRIHAIVSGRVQGVCYRAFTRDAARRIGNLSGWVRNLPDGTVELEAEGPPESVDALLERCNEGPPYGRVSRIVVDEQTPLGDTSGFEIRYS